MVQSIRQAVLGVGLRDEATFDNFFIGQNDELLTQLKNISKEPKPAHLFLYGSQGLGKSHLLQACCHYANSHHFASIYLPFEMALAQSPDIFEGLEDIPLVCLDDLHLMAGQKKWEEAFFYFYNRIHDRGNRLIITAHKHPKNLGLILPDVVSRLTFGMVYQLQVLTDEEKLQAFIKRAKLRGIDVARDVAQFLLNHCSREMKFLLLVLDMIDKESLIIQRRPTIPLIKKILEQMQLS